MKHIVSFRWSNAPFYLERCYVYNIFTTNHRWLVVIGSNLKLTLKLIFYLKRMRIIRTKIKEDKKMEKE